jgi:hypothetical protein
VCVFVFNLGGRIFVFVLTKELKMSSDKKIRRRRRRRRREEKTKSALSLSLSPPPPCGVGVFKFLIISLQNMVNAPRTVKDAPANEFVISLAQYFRSSGKVRR